MTDATVVVLDDERLTEKGLDRWRDYFAKLMTDQATEKGKFPHRAGSTGLAMSLEGMNGIIELAKQAVRMKDASGREAKVLAAEYLRQIAAGLERDEA